MTHQLLAQLAQLPDHWPFVAVDGNKRAYQMGWQTSPLTKEQVATEVRAGRAHAVGVIAGPPSGLLFLDHDGISATTQLERLGIPLQSLPKSWAFTSGREGRFQIAYLVPEEFWPALRNRRFWYTGEPDPATGKATKVVGPDGKAEQIDLRWACHYSVVIGAHPETTGYRWLTGRAPHEQALAEAPLALIELLIDQPPPAAPLPLLATPQQQAAPKVVPTTAPEPPPAAPLPLLDFISRASRQLIESGGTPGSWNDAQLALALDLQGTEAWIRHQGHQPDITASQAFGLHIDAARPKARDFDERKSWARFEGATSRAPQPSTPESKLNRRLRFHTRSQRSLPSQQRQQQGNHPGSPDGSPLPPADTRPLFPFDLLGFDADGLFFQPHATGQVVRLGRGSLTGTNLVSLAPYEWWEACYPGGRGGPNWTMVASDLHARQAAVGIFDPARIRGRGAWWDDGRAVLHLGDRLLVDGQPQPLQLPRSRFSYQRLAAIGLPTDVQPLTDEQGAGIIEVASGFLWDVPASGLLLAGWAALAPICGALQWRPHVWLTAGKGSGKSTLLDRFLGTLLEDLAIWPEGSTTEASIRQELRCDALPVVMDEAESNEQTDRTRMQAILSLARVSSSSGRGFVGRGGAEGQAQRFVVRSMFLLCSINPALKHGADESRFAQLTMRNPSTLPETQREQHWQLLDACLAQQITREAGHAMAARMVRLIPIVRDAVAVFRRAAAQRLGSQRQGDQYGTLLAGAWCLMHDSVPTDAEALQLINNQNWEPYQEPSGESDEHRCLQHILQAPQRVEIERLSVDGARVHSRAVVLTRTVWELIEACRGGEEAGDIPAPAAAAHLGRLGLRLDADRLLISNTAEGLRRVLRDTPWGASWSTVLARLDGAERRAGVRFKGLAGSSRAVAIRVFTD